MIRLLIRLLITATAVVVAAHLLSGVTVVSFGSAIAVAIVIGILGLFVEPILQLIALPITVMTFGLFSIVVNAIVILLADGLLDGFDVNGILWAIGFSFIVSFVSSFLKGIAGEKD